MHQTVLARQDVDEGTEVDDALDLADVDLADLGFGSDGQHALLGSLGRFLGFAEDLDRAIVFDIDRSLGLLADTTDGRAAFTDDVADLVLVDLHRNHGRRVGRQLAARLGDDLVHLAEDVQASFQRLLQRLLHDLFGDALDLDVHLQCSNAIGGTGNLEVHVAQVIFVAEDVGQNGKLVAFLDQAHGDTGNRCLHRYTSIHQGQRSAADGSHRGRAVGLGDFRNHTNGVREHVSSRQHGLNRTTCQTAVTDFAAASGAHTTTLTDRVRREVVVQHEGVFALAFEGVQQLRVASGTEGGNDQCLGFATGEQRRTVGLVQNADFDVQATHGTGVTAIDTRLAVDDVLAHGAVFDLAEGFFDFTSGRLTFFTGELGNDLIFQLAQTRIAVLLDGDGVSLGNCLTKLATDSAQQSSVLGFRLPVPGRLGGFGGQLGNSLDDRLEFLMGKQHGAQHLVFGQLFGFRFNHQHGVLGARYDHVQAGGLELLVVRVQQVAGFRVEGDARSTDRAVERDTGDGQGSRGTDHRSDVRIGLLAGGNHGADDLHFVLETFREQRTDRTIDQTRGQGFFLGRTRFTLEETTWDLAGSVGLFLVVHGQREEAFAWVCSLGAGYGDQHADVVINGDQHCAGGLTGNTASLEGNGRLTELEFLDYRVHGVFLLFVALGEIGKKRGSRTRCIPRKAKSWEPSAPR